MQKKLILKIERPFYLFINKINVNFGESNGNEYFTLVPYDESKGILRNTTNYRANSGILLDQ